MRRIVAGLLLATLGGAGTAVAQRTGLLLGVAGDSTLWLTVRGDTLAVRRGPGVFVPRRDGFWQLQWVNPGFRCPPQAANLRLQSSPVGAVGVMAAPLGRRGPLPAITDATTCDPNYLTDSDESVRYQAALRFVGTDHVVLEYHYENYGASVETRLWRNDAFVLTLDTLGRAGFAFRDGREPADPLGQAVQDSLFTICDPNGDPALDTDVLGLHRVAGHWAYDARVYSDCKMCDNTARVCPLDERLPRELVGFDSLTVAWSAIVQKVPRALDAFTSPRGDVAVVRDSSSLQVFRAAGGALTDRLGAVPLGGKAEIVLAQWALGASVVRWDAVLDPRLGPPRP